VQKVLTVTIGPLARELSRSYYGVAVPAHDIFTKRVHDISALLKSSVVDRNFVLKIDVSVTMFLTDNREN